MKYLDNNLEALNWLSKNQNNYALATNRFENNSEALEFVQKLYEAGANHVTVDNIDDNEQRIQDEGGAYADSLIVTLPEDVVSRKRLFEIFNQEAYREGFDEYLDDSQETVTLWWD